MTSISSFLTAANFHIHLVLGCVVQGPRVEVSAYSSGQTTVMMVVCGHVTSVSLIRFFRQVTRSKYWMFSIKLEQPVNERKRQSCSPVIVGSLGIGGSWV